MSMNHLFYIFVSISHNNVLHEIAKDRKADTLMDWETYNQKMPWNIIIILGGGFTLAKAVQVG